MSMTGVHGQTAVQFHQQTPDQQMATLKNEVSNKSIGERFVGWLRNKGVIKSNDQTMVNFRTALQNKVGQEGAKAIIDKLNLAPHRSLSDRKATEAIALATHLETAQSSPLFQSMGETKFMERLTGAWSAMATAGVNRSDVPLTDEEIVAINLYTTDAYKTLNPEVRSGNMSPTTQAWLNAVNSGLDKLPDFKGPVHRGIEQCSDSLDKTLMQGKTVSDLTVTSTSASKDDAFVGSHKISIESKHGKDVSFLSNSPGEKEVLFKPGTNFQILDRVDNRGYGMTSMANGVCLVMKEV